MNVFTYYSFHTIVAMGSGHATIPGQVPKYAMNVTSFKHDLAKTVIDEPQNIHSTKIAFTAAADQ